MMAQPLAIDRRRMIGAGTALFLSGCGAISLLPKPMEPQLYLLRPQAMAPMGAPVPWRLAIGTPDASASLDTTRIALTRSATSMDYFANAAWNDRMPLIVQRSLIESFDSSGRIVSVARDTAGLESDYLLESEIRDFEARYETAQAIPQIVVSIEAKLVRMPTRSIVASFNASSQAIASANNIDSIVLAFDQAAGGAISQIAAWTFGTAPAPEITPSRP
jgi:cholesterol transport system auxiliary component